jgi:hypothetical protein
VVMPTYKMIHEPKHLNWSKFLPHSQIRAGVESRGERVMGRHPSVCAICNIIRAISTLLGHWWLCNGPHYWSQNTSDLLASVLRTSDLQEKFNSLPKLYKEGSPQCDTSPLF